MNTLSKDLEIPPAPLTPEAKSMIDAALALCDDTPIAVTNKQEAEDATAELEVVKGAMKRIEDCRMSFTRPLDDLKKRWIAFFSPTLERLAHREETYKGAIAGFVRAERARVAEEQRQADEAARLEQERLDKEAERKAKAAEKKGDADGAQAIRDAVPVVTAPPVKAAEQPKGFSVREVWKGECTNKMALIKAIAAGTASEELVTVNQSALNKTASALKALFKIPGCRAYTEHGSSARSA